MSKKYIIKDTTMTNIGDAIRKQTGNTELLSPAQMVDEIDIYLGDIKGLGGRTRTKIKHNGIDYVAPYAFYSYSTLTSVELPNCIGVGDSAFVSCTSLNYISLPKCISASTTAFAGCTKITDATLGFSGTITNANIPFREAHASILRLSFPACTFISANTFSSARYKALQEVYASECLNLGANAFQSCPSLNTVYLPKCASASTTAFAKCASITNATIGFSEVTSTNFPFADASAVLEEIHLPKCTSVGSMIFGAQVASKSGDYYWKTSSAKYLGITVIDLPVCTSIGSYAFAECNSFSSIDLPVCTHLGGGAFYGCAELKSIDLPACTSIGDATYIYSDSTLGSGTYGGAFGYCFRLNSIDLPVCTSIGSAAFIGCINLRSINLPVCTNIGNYAFNECFIHSIDLLSCTNIGEGAFMGCGVMESINLPVCTHIGSYAFKYSPGSVRPLSITDTESVEDNSPVTISFHVCTNIGDQAFFGQSKLASVYLAGSAVVNIGKGVFGRTPIVNSSYTGAFGSIYVPSSLVDTYKAADNWSAYADRITAIPG